MSDTNERMTDKQIDKLIELLEVGSTPGGSMAIKAIRQYRTDLAAMTERTTDTPKPDFPDRVARIGADGLIERVLHGGSTIAEGQRIETIRTWVVGDDGLTTIERYAQQQIERVYSLEDEREDSLGRWNQIATTIADLDAALAENARLREQRDAAVEALEKVDPFKLNTLASWIDLKTPDNPDTEVQTELRVWARMIDSVLARIRELRESALTPPTAPAEAGEVGQAPRSTTPVC